MKIKLLTFHVLLLNLLGLWPKGKRGILAIFHTAFILAMQLMNCLGGLINMIKCSGDLKCILENIAYSLLTVMGILNFLACLVNEKQFQRAVVGLHDLTNQFGTHAYTEKAEKISRLFSVTFTIYASLGLLQYGIAPLVDYNNCIKRDVEYGALICGLPTPGWFPFDYTSSPGYEVAFVLQNVWSTLCIKSLVQTTLICCSIIYHLIAHLVMVQDSLKGIGNVKPEKRSKLLRNYVAHHAAVLHFYSKISPAFNQVMTTHSLIMPLIFSVLGTEMVQILVTSMDIWNFQRYVIIFMGSYVLVLVLSILGQKLINESRHVAEAAYNTLWYEESLEFQKMVRLIILRSNKPLVLQSASINDLSFPSFTKINSSTYSYLTLLYNLLLAEEI